MKYQALNTELDENLNLYGVIIDASYPVQTVKDKWVCIIKVIDGKVHTDGDLKNDTFEFVVIVIYASRFEDCPIVR